MKALRREFQLLFGRAAETTIWGKPERLIRRDYEILHRSEWRQWKKRRNVESSDTRSTRQQFERLRHNHALEENDLRIVDSRLHRNQAYGKMKRAGVFATRRRS